MWLCYSFCVYVCVTSTNQLTNTLFLQERGVRCAQLLTTTLDTTFFPGYLLGVSSFLFLPFKAISLAICVRQPKTMPSAVGVGGTSHHRTGQGESQSPWLTFLISVISGFFLKNKICLLHISIHVSGMASRLCSRTTTSFNLGSIYFTGQSWFLYIP